MAQDLALIVGITMLCMLSPGPDMVLVMRNTLGGDRRSGLATSLGVLTGNFVHITYCLLGVGVVVAHSVVAYGVLKFAGAAYLIFLGITGFRNAKSEPPLDARNEAAAGTRSKSGASARAGSSYVQGLFNNLLNPKGALFYLGVFTQVITPSSPLWRVVTLVSAMVLTSAAFWIVFVATLHLPPVRTWLARSRQTLERAFGVLLVLLGLRVAAQE